MEFVKLRRQDRAVSEADAKRLLALADWGVLALTPDENGYPHAVPINCAYVDGELLMHCAREGKKLEILRRDPHACFTATIWQQIAPSEFTTRYESVVCYGRMELVPAQLCAHLLTKFTAGVLRVPESEVAAKAGQAAPATQMLRMHIDHISAKRSGSHSRLPGE